MDIDTMLFKWSNSWGDCLHAAGENILQLTNLWGCNPFFTKPANQLARYGRFMIERGRQLETPAWHTPNRVIYEGFKVALRKFNREHRGNPVLFVAPEAGHNSHIVDYGPGQSLIECALEHFDGDVYAVDKLPAGPAHTTYSMDDCVRSIQACVEAIGEPVHLVGLCQGGWQTAIYSALFPDHVRTITLAAAPIDFHAGDAAISKWARSLPLAYYEQLVQAGGGNMPGCFIVQGFMLMNPYDRFVGDNMDLMTHAADPAFVERHRRFTQWYYYTQAVPGTLYLQIVRRLFQENRLVQGRLEILGRRVELKRITQPLFLVAGAKDDITPPAQLFAAADHVQSGHVRQATVNAGHVGVFMGKQVIRDYWSNHLTALPAVSLAN